MPTRIVETIVDTAQMIPFLLGIYFLIAIWERYFSHKITHKIKQAGRLGPILGAGLGSIPQCGFSVISTALYNKKLITLGTLMAVYLATSDEAIAVFLSSPGQAHIIRYLLSIKIIIAIVAGYCIDIVLRKSQKKTLAHSGHLDPEDICNKQINIIQESGCCGHKCTTSIKPPKWWIHPILHTAKITGFILIASLIIARILDIIGYDRLQLFLLKGSFLQPIITGFVGLIPNCAISVLIAKLFISGGLSLGSTIAGLSTGAGLGILVLSKHQKPQESIKIIALLYIIGTIAGLLVQYYIS